MLTGKACTGSSTTIPCFLSIWYASNILGISLISMLQTNSISTIFSLTRGEERWAKY